MISFTWPKSIRTLPPIRVISCPIVPLLTKGVKRLLLGFGQVISKYHSVDLLDTTIHVPHMRPK